MSFEWPPEEYAKLDPFVQEARVLMEDWFQAMESGAADSRAPDPLYPVGIDSAVADKIVKHIDEEFERELRGWASSEAAGSYTVGPGFCRLKPAQRLAFAQQLHALKVRLVRPVPDAEQPEAKAA